jgi:hypothetical protein
LGLQKAVRKGVWLKVAVSGVSGSGKTWGLLELATGVAKKIREAEKLSVDDPRGRIALIDTESGRGLYYADDFDYDYDAIKAPFTPETYIDKIDEIMGYGYRVIIIDSTSHEWAGEGGCLEIQSKIPGNSYTAWGQVTPRHKKFIEKIISSPAHFFVSVRSKDEYVLEESNGKKIPKKVGMGVVQRNEFEYDYTVMFAIDRDRHIATASKDNTKLFDTWNEPLKSAHGVMLYDWANSDEGKNMEVRDTKPTINKATTAGIPAEAQTNEGEPIDLKTMVTDIDKLAKELAKKDKEGVVSVIKECYGKSNYNALLTDANLTEEAKLQMAADIYKALKQLKEKLA